MCCCCYMYDSTKYRCVSHVPYSMWKIYVGQYNCVCVFVYVCMHGMCMAQRISRKHNGGETKTNGCKSTFTAHLAWKRPFEGEFFCVCVHHILMLYVLHVASLFLIGSIGLWRSRSSVLSKFSPFVHWNTDICVRVWACVCMRLSLKQTLQNAHTLPYKSALNTNAPRHIHTTNGPVVFPPILWRVRLQHYMREKYWRIFHVHHSKSSVVIDQFLSWFFFFFFSILLLWVSLKNLFRINACLVIFLINSNLC